MLSQLEVNLGLRSTLMHPVITGSKQSITRYYRCSGTYRYRLAAILHLQRGHETFKVASLVQILAVSQHICCDVLLALVACRPIK
jgi:hypothetical protein